MDAFINSLPRQNGASMTFRSEEDSEGNYCTRKQVAAVKAKGWSILSGTSPYEGIDSSNEDERVPQDVNGDGVVDTQDVLEIYKYIQEH